MICGGQKIDEIVQYCFKIFRHRMLSVFDSIKVVCFIILNKKFRSFLKDHILK